MTTDTHDPRDIPVLTDVVAQDAPGYALVDPKAVHAAVVTATLNLADSLLHQAIKDIEATLFERVFDRLRTQLPELVDGVLREHAAVSSATASTAEASAATASTAAASPAASSTGDAAEPDA